MRAARLARPRRNCATSQETRGHKSFLAKRSGRSSRLLERARQVVRGLKRAVRLRVDRSWREDASAEEDGRIAQAGDIGRGAPAAGAVVDVDRPNTGRERKPT